LLHSWREEEGGPRKGHAVPIISGDDRRRLVPLAVVQVLTVLLDELEDAPSHVRLELKTLRSRLCRLYGLPTPAMAANPSDVAQMMEDADGVPIEE